METILIGQCSIAGYEVPEYLEDIVAYIDDTKSRVQLGPYSKNSKIFDSININTPNLLIKITHEALRYASEHRPIVINEQPIYMDHMKYLIGRIYLRETPYKQVEPIKTVYMRWLNESGCWDIFVQDYEDDMSREEIEINEYLKLVNPSIQGVVIAKMVDGWKTVYETQKYLTIYLHNTDKMFVPDPFNKKEHINSLMIQVE